MYPASLPDKSGSRFFVVLKSQFPEIAASCSSENFSGVTALPKSA